MAHRALPLQFRILNPQDEMRLLIGETHIQTKSGARILVEGTIVREVRAGSLYMMSVIFCTVIEQRKLYQVYDGHAAHYQTMIEALEAGAVLQDVDGSIRACNGSAERILGLTAQQLLGRALDDPIWRAVYEDEIPFPGDMHPALVALRTGQPCSNVVMGIHHPDGRLVWISVSSQPLFHGDAMRLYAVVTTLVDISERKQLEVQLREQEAQYRSLFEHSVDAMLIVAADRQLLAANREAIRIFGFTESDLKISGRTLIQDPSDPRWAAAIAERDRTGAFRGELRFRRKDTSTFPGEVFSAHYHDHHGNLRTSIIVRDISRRYYLENELRRASSSSALFCRRSQILFG